ncbi:MAG: DUF4282 domain-containing protein [Gemmatimonadales bacterium]|nr:DUF4282 domain-containing protein [Gemmatimonadales bacterium]
MTDRGIAASLFDLSFSHFITPKIQRILYALLLVVAGGISLAVLGAALGMGSGFFGKAGGLLIGIPAAVLVFFFVAMYARVMMEMLIVVFRGVEYLGEIAAAVKREGGSPLDR